MTEEERAKSLAQWLDSPNGTPAPLDLEADVLETIVAFKPGKAPAPRVSIDEILAMVSEGPLAAPGMGESTGDPDTGPVAEVVQFPGSRRPVVPEENPETPAVWGWSNWFTRGAMVSAITLAATLAIVTNVYNQSGQSAAPGDAPGTEPVTHERTIGTPAADENVGADAHDPKPVANVPGDRDREALEKVGYFDDLAAPKQPVGQNVAIPVAPKPGPMPRNEGIVATEPPVVVFDPAPPPVVTGNGASNEMGELPSPEISFDARFNDVKVPSLATESIDRSVAAGEADASGIEAEDVAELAAVGRKATASPPSAGAAKDLDVGRELAKQKEEARSKKQAGKPSNRQADNIKLDNDMVDAPKLPASGRNTAVPSDLVLQTTGYDTKTQTRINAAISAADAKTLAGDLTGAGDVYAAEIKNPVKAGQTMAIYAAQSYMAANKPLLAKSAVQKGLALATTNTPEKSFLLVLFGDASRELGDDQSAATMWETATRLNNER